MSAKDKNKLKEFYADHTDGPSGQSFVDPNGAVEAGLGHENRPADQVMGDMKDDVRPGTEQSLMAAIEANRGVILGGVLNQLANMKNPKELADALIKMGYSAENIETMAHSNRGADQNGRLGTQNPSMLPTTEEFKQIFERFDLSDQELSKISTLFESYLSLAIVPLVEKIEENKKSEIEDGLLEIIEGLDEYTTYMASEYLKENAIAVDNQLRLAILENFTQNLKSLFESTYIEVPESKLNIVEQALHKVEEIEEFSQKVIVKNKKLTEELEKTNRQKIVESLSKDLSSVEKAKLELLSESVQGKSLKDYENKVKILKETHFNKKQMDSLDKEEELLGNEYLIEEKKLIENEVDFILQSLSKSKTKKT